MKKKYFKVAALSNENKIYLRKELGYFCHICDYKFFVYKLSSTWYVIDLGTGLSVGKGDTLAQAKNDAQNNLTRVLKIRETESYTKTKIRYNELLKEGDDKNDKKAKI